MSKRRSLLSKSIEHNERWRRQKAEINTKLCKQLKYVHNKMYCVDRNSVGKQKPLKVFKKKMRWMKPTHIYGI